VNVGSKGPSDCIWEQPYSGLGQRDCLVRPTIRSGHED